MSNVKKDCHKREWNPIYTVDVCPVRSIYINIFVFMSLNWICWLQGLPKSIHWFIYSFISSTHMCIYVYICIQSVFNCLVFYIYMYTMGFFFVLYLAFFTYKYVFMYLYVHRVNILFGICIFQNKVYLCINMYIERVFTIKSVFIYLYVHRVSVLFGILYLLKWWCIYASICT